MHKATAGLLLTIVLAAPTRAQVPDAVRTLPAARNAALGGAGAALPGSLDGRQVNPALLGSTTPDRAISVGVAESGADVVHATIGLALDFGGWGTWALDARHRRVDDIIDDPELAGAPGLQVSDLSIRLSTATSLAGGDLLLGGAIEHSTSQVFGTTGAGWSGAIGARVRLPLSLSAGAAVVRLGPDYRWRTVLGTESRSPLGTALAVGSAWAAVDTRALAVRFASDVELPLTVSSARVWRAGTEVVLARILALRGGYEYTEGLDGSPALRSPAVGFGLRVRALQVDIARDHLQSSIGERTLVNIALRW